MEAHPQIFTTTTATLTDSRGTWLVGHACGRDAAAAAAAAASPPHVSEFGGACVCVCVCGCGCGCVCVCGCVCGCAACVDAYAETWSGGEKRGYGGCVLVPFSCSIHHHHHHHQCHHLHVPHPLHAHAYTEAVHAECCALAPSFITLLSLLLPFLPSPPVLGHKMQVLACEQKPDVCCHTTAPVQTGEVVHCEHVWHGLSRGGWVES